MAQIPRVAGLATVSLQLPTPELLSIGLRMIGVTWEPSEDLTTDPGMYVWVDTASSADLRHAGVLYIGVGEGESGVLQRVLNEGSWRDGDHAHGIAIRRRSAKAIGAPLGWEQGVGPNLLKQSLDNSTGERTARAWVTRTHQERSLRAVEEFAIRLAIHLGDVGAPVNSSHAGAWNNTRGADWGAFAVATAMAEPR